MHSHNVLFRTFSSVLMTIILAMVCGREINEVDTTGILVQLERISCICGEHCTIKLCKTRAVSRYIVTGSTILVAKKNVTAAKFTLKTFYKFSNNEYRPMLINTEIDFCAIQAGLYTNPLMNLFKKTFANYTNFLDHKCPFPPGEYYVKEISAKASMLPSIFPVGRYLAIMAWYIGSNDWYFNISAYFSVANMGIQDWSIG